MRRFLSIWLPHWPIESRLRNRSKQMTQHSHQALAISAKPEANTFLNTPFALIQGGAKGIEITASNQAAEIAGVTKGMSLTDARALATNLITEAATPELDSSRLHHLALWCLRYSPLVTVRAPDDILIDLTGCVHLFGGEKQILTDLQTRLHSFKLTSRLGLSDTIGAAWAASHYGQNTKTLIPPGEQHSFLSPLPISALQLEESLVSRLHQLGLRHIKQLLDLLTPSLTKRFGPVLVNRLQQAIGSSPEIFTSLSPPPDYSLNHPFMEPICYLDGISSALEKLTTRMSLLLEKQKKAARQLQINLFRVDGHVDQIHVSTSRPCHKALHMLLLFRERLSLLGEEINAGFGYDLMTLDAFDVETRLDQQSSWNTEEDQEQESLSRLLDRFGNRFGFDQISYWANADSHIPERSIQTTSAKGAQTSIAPPPINLQRPLLLLPRAAPITVLAEVPDGPPIRFEWHRQQHLIIAAEGPERIAPEWWREVSQESFQTRDYFRVEDKNGYRFWIYRDGLYERSEDHPRWFIHGFFS